MEAIKNVMDCQIDSKDDVSRLNRDITANYISAADNSLTRERRRPGQITTSGSTGSAENPNESATKPQGTTTKIPRTLPP